MSFVPREIAPESYPLAWREEGSFQIGESERTGLRYVCFWLSGRALRMIETDGGGHLVLEFDTLSDAKEHSQWFDDWQKPKKKGNG